MNELNKPLIIKSEINLALGWQNWTLKAQLIVFIVNSGR